MCTSFIYFTMCVFYDCMTRESNPDSFVSIKYLSIYVLMSISSHCPYHRTMYIVLMSISSHYVPLRSHVHCIDVNIISLSLPSHHVYCIEGDIISLPLPLLPCTLHRCQYHLTALTIAPCTFFGVNIISLPSPSHHVHCIDVNIVSQSLPLFPWKPYWCKYHPLSLPLLPCTLYRYQCHLTLLTAAPMYTVSMSISSHCPYRCSHVHGIDANIISLFLLLLPCILILMSISPHCPHRCSHVHCIDVNIISLPLPLRPCTRPAHHPGSYPGSPLPRQPVPASHPPSARKTRRQHNHPPSALSTSPEITSLNIAEMEQYTLPCRHGRRWHWKLKVILMTTLLSLTVTKVVIMTMSGYTSDGKIDINLRFSEEYATGIKRGDISVSGWKVICMATLIVNRLNRIAIISIFCRMKPRFD